MATTHIVTNLQGSFVHSVDVKRSEDNTELSVIVTRGNSLQPPLPVLRFRIPASVHINDVEAFINNVPEISGPVDLVSGMLDEVRELAAELKPLSRTAFHCIQMISIKSDLSVAERYLEEAKQVIPVNSLSMMFDYFAFVARCRYSSLAAVETAVGRAEERVNSVLGLLVAEQVITPHHRDEVVSQVGLSRFKMNIIANGFRNKWFF